MKEVAGALGHGGLTKYIGMMAVLVQCVRIFWLLYSSAELQNIH